MTSPTTAGPDLLRFEGELDASVASEMRGLLRRIVDSGQVEELAIDMSAVTFIDSTALGVLFGAHCRFASAGGRLRVVDPSPTVERVLRVTGLSYWLHE